MFNLRQKLELQNPTLGSFCCVCSEFDEWHRAQIIDINEVEQDVTVSMVDIGEIKKIAINKDKILKVCIS